jgi:PIN domain
VRTNIVLIDSENVQPDSIEKLRHDHFRVCVFLGANQKRIDIAIVKAVQALGANGEYVQISGNGPNALDFHIAFYIGKYSGEYPDAYFHIISKDKGFDPLINHLEEQKIFCSRSASVSEIPLLKSTNNRSPKDLAAEFFEKRIRPAKKGPLTVKKLHNSIHSHFLKRLSEEQVLSVVEALRTSGRITLNGQKVVYGNK